MTWCRRLYDDDEVAFLTNVPGHHRELEEKNKRASYTTMKNYIKEVAGCDTPFSLPKTNSFAKNASKPQGRRYPTASPLCRRPPRSLTPYHLSP